MVPQVPHAHPAKAALIIRRISQRRVAHILGLSEQTVGRFLNRRAPASPAFKAGLAELLEVPEDELFLEDDTGFRRKPRTTPAQIRRTKQRAARARRRLQQRVES